VETNISVHSFFSERWLKLLKSFLPALPFFSWPFIEIREVMSMRKNKRKGKEEERKKEWKD
jgi:hypothetical protein